MPRHCQPAEWTSKTQSHSSFNALAVIKSPVFKMRSLHTALRLMETVKPSVLAEGHVLTIMKRIRVHGSTCMFMDMHVYI